MWPGTYRNLRGSDSGSFWCTSCCLFVSEKFGKNLLKMRLSSRVHVCYLLHSAYTHIPIFLLGFTITMVKTIVFVILFFIIILLHFFFSDFHQTSQVGTLGGPYYTDPISVTLTYFSMSQTHFSAKNKKLKIVITLLFLARFWSNFTWM